MKHLKIIITHEEDNTLTTTELKPILIPDLENEAIEKAIRECLNKLLEIN
jgi:hypothetical protein